MKTVITIRLDNSTLAEIAQACSEYNEHKSAMIRYLVMRGLDEYRRARAADKKCTNVLQLLELKQASAYSRSEC